MIAPMARCAARPLTCGVALLAVSLGALARGGEGPSSIAASPDGKTVYVGLEDGGGGMAVVDPSGLAPVRVLTSPGPGPVRGVAVAEGGQTLIAAGGTLPGWLAWIDAATGDVKRRVALGHSPRAPVVSANGSPRVWVLEPFDGRLVELDGATGKLVRRIAVGREPFAMARTPDGKTLVIANLLPAGQADQGVVASTVTLVDTASGTTRSVVLPNGSTAARGVAVSPDGSQAVVTHLIGRFHMPASQLDRGWMMTNAVSIVDLTTESLVGTALLDEIDRGAANPWGVAVSGDGSRIVVTHAGTHELSVIDRPALLKKLAETKPPAIPPANDLAFLVGLRTRVRLNADVPATGEPLLQGPRDAVMIGNDVFTPVHFANVLARMPLDASAAGAVVTLPLGPSSSPDTPERRGERLFQDATVCFQGWQSCASCHPDTRADGLNWDLLNDSLGNPKNTKSLLLAMQTPPSMFLGVRADAPTAVRAGFHHILFAEPTTDQAKAVDAYLQALKPDPGPALVGEDRALGEAARRGQALFESARLRCAHCHPAPLYTDLKMHDVATRGPRDRTDRFDTPTLVEAWRTAPYLHDGRYASFEALFREGRHGLPKDDGQAGLSDAELADLIAFLRSI
jgi:DNA-binding beta-propeller fold protein YncE/mono/diheme cytochrome c family protein